MTCIFFLEKSHCDANLALGRPTVSQHCTTLSGTFKTLFFTLRTLFKASTINISVQRSDQITMFNMKGGL